MPRHAHWPVRVDPLYLCWLWLGRTDRDGYGIMSVARGTSRLAHRVVYETETGPVPEGKALDHLCRRRRCVNPAHLEPVSGSENERRKLWRVRSRRTECGKGHDLEVYGIITPEGGKVCRQCDR